MKLSAEPVGEAVLFRVEDDERFVEVLLAPGQALRLGEILTRAAHDTQTGAAHAAVDRAIAAILDE